jgi:EH domain-containing protein 1
VYWRLLTGLLSSALRFPLQVQREHHLPPGDFPDVNRFRDILSAFDFSSFPKLSKSMVKQIDDVLSVDIPNLVRAFDNPYS